MAYFSLLLTMTIHIHKWHLYCATHVYEYVHNEQQQQYSISKICIITSHLDTKQKKSTLTGFEPARAKPSGFQVHLLNHSDTVSRCEVPFTYTFFRFTVHLGAHCLDGYIDTNAPTYLLSKVVLSSIMMVGSSN